VNDFPMKASVVFATKNRKEDLRRALASTVLQQPEPEIIVMDDGSTDGTADMVRTEFPRVVLHQFDQSCGSSVRRNQGVRLATGDIIVSIDDDAEFTTPRVVAQAVGQFDDPRVGAVTIPYIDVRISPDILQEPPDPEGVWVTNAYVGTAAAWRKDVFLDLEGYSEFVLHMSEERDYCLRLLNAGFVVKMGRTDLIRHYQSPVRKSRWNRRMQRRNDLIHAVTNIPFPPLLFHFPGTILSGLLFGLRNECLGDTLAGYWWFIRVLGTAVKLRHPVSRQCYSLARHLQRHGPQRLDEIGHRLPALARGTQLSYGQASPE